jgi:hypothetical protein
VDQGGKATAKEAKIETDIDQNYFFDQDILKAVADY